MTLKDIASVAGKSGLYRVLKPSRTGVLLETIDDKKSKMIANAQQRVSILKEVSIYANNNDGSVPLREVFLTMQEKFGAKIEVNVGDNKALLGFLAQVVPDYDKEKVYPSDVKKLISWYHILAQYHPEVFTAQEETEENKTEEVAENEATATESVEK
jgi:hypothetical protein